MCVRGTRPLRTRGGRVASGLAPGSSGIAHCHHSSDAFEMSVRTSPAAKLSSVEFCAHNYMTGENMRYVRAKAAKALMCVSVLYILCLLLSTDIKQYYVLERKLNESKRPLRPTHISKYNI